MHNLSYTIDVAASKQRVWEVMLGPETYKQWASAFQPNSYFVGSWEQGQEIRFVSEEDNGQSGILSVVEESRPFSFVSLRTVAEIVEGQPTTESEGALAMVGTHENYSFTEHDGVTTILVEMTGETIDDEIKEMFDGMWPAALKSLKTLVEARG